MTDSIAGALRQIGDAAAGRLPLRDHLPGPAPARLDRAAFDALVQRRCMALSEAAATSSSHPAALDEAHAAMQDAVLLEARAAEFADAIDRDSTGLAYEDAVVIFGSSGPVVVTVDDYDRETIYHEARAGRVELVAIGPRILAYLRG